ncbi:MAG: LysM peptidoglycan-binding domain-containing protein [Nitrospina sp.]|nr:MAG: LysM peptidoglycan-binding domain-containing protein [Nitrospina sp.]
MNTIKPTFLYLLLALFLFGVISSPTLASYSGNDFHAPSETESETEYDFSVPVGLEPQVNFWKKIYTQYTTKHAVIHDMDDPSIIYEVVYLGDQVLSSRMRNKKIRPKIAKYKRILSKLARVKNQSRLSSEEKRVAGLVEYNFSKAARNIRMQLGQKDRFKEGIRISGRYMDRIREIFNDLGLPEELTVLPHVESSFQVNAFSSAGAAGVWQFTRRTGRRFMKIGYEVDERIDPILSAHAAAKLLKYNYGKIQSWPLAITAYNHGLRGMTRAKKKFGDDIVQIIKHYRKRTFGFASKNFYAEFLAALEVSQNPRKYFPDIKMEKPLQMKSIKVRDYIDISTMIKYLGMTRGQIAEFNPALRRPVITGKKRIPKNFVFQATIDEFPELASLYQSIPDNLRHKKQVRSRWYTIRRGDTLSTIARRLGTSVRKLKEANNIGFRNRIYRGQVLELPGWKPHKRKIIRVASKTPNWISPKDFDGKVTNYKIKRRDTLTHIARKFRISVGTLAAFNQMENPNNLRRGQIIKIPTYKVVQKANLSEAPIQVAQKLEVKITQPEPEKVRLDPENENNASQEKPQITFTDASPELVLFNKNRPAFTPVKFVTKNKKNYPVGIIKVDFDETLSHIADWARISVNELRRVNNLRRRSIRIHQKIKVPFRRVQPQEFEQKRQEYHKFIQEDFYNNYRVEKVVIRNIKKGETLWEICNDIYTIPLWLLDNYNPDKNIHSLAIGQPIIIPVITKVKA